MEGDSHGPVVQEAINQLQDGILHGRFIPGQRLVEADLMRDLGVGRDSIRNALRHLVAVGIVTLQAYKGASVRKVTRRDLAEIFGMREALEGMAAALVAQRIDLGTNRKVMEKALARNAEHHARNIVAAYVRDNQHFHDTIVALANNKGLADGLAQLQIPVYRWQFHEIIVPKSMDRSFREHERIAMAILGGRADAAERAMRRHVRNSGRVLQEFDDKFFG